MANYNLVINSRFRPFSYEELLRPVHASTEAHKMQEERFAEQRDLAEKISGLLNKEKDPVAYARYESFIRDLKARTAELAGNGIRMGDYSKFLDLRSQYNTNLLPIMNLYQQREAEINRQRIADENNPTIVRSKNASDISIDELLENPNAINEIKSARGDLMAKQANDAAVAISKQIMDYKTGKAGPEAMKNLAKLFKIMPFTYNMVIQKGTTAQQVMDAILGNENALPFLLSIVNNVMKSSGVEEWTTPEQYERLRNYTAQGLWGSAGETLVSTVQDQYGMQSALQAQEEAAKRRLAALSGSGGSGGSGGGYYDNPTSGIRPNVGTLLNRGGDNVLAKYSTKHANGRWLMDYGKLAKALGVDKEWLKKNLFDKGRLRTSKELMRAYANTYQVYQPGSGGPSVNNSQFGTGMGAGVGKGSYRRPKNSEVARFDYRVRTLYNEMGSAGIKGKNTTDFNNSWNAFMYGDASTPGARAYATHQWGRLSEGQQRTARARIANDVREFKGFDGTNMRTGKKVQIPSDAHIELEGVLGAGGKYMIVTITDKDGNQTTAVTHTSSIMQGYTNEYIRWLNAAQQDPKNGMTYLGYADDFSPYVVRALGDANISGEQNQFYQAVK